MTENGALADAEARERALDTTRSFLVQSPAGSGKTELLAMRILKLLAGVEEPEQVLAITFARDATAEMRHRILKKLETAKQYLERGNALEKDDPATLRIAIAVLERSNQRGWRLLEQPERVNIQTIDSLCLRIAHRMPLQARLSGTLEPIENATPLYRQAARRTLDRLGGADPDLNRAMKSLLSHRDSNLKELESLLETMLATRDQWGHAFPLTGEIDWDLAKVRLEEPLHREINRVLGEAHSLLSARPDITAELLELANYACKSDELKYEIRLLAGLKTLPAASPQFVDHWYCLSEFLLTQSNQLRKGYNVSYGFPPRDKGEKVRMAALIARLGDAPKLVALLGEVRNLPPPQYSSDQWQMLQHMFTALRQAVLELNAVFAEEGAVDFVEISTAALEVLKGSAAEEVRTDRGQDIRHLLIDEFQDTSRRQHELISALIQDWRGDDGRTVFVVGDPMQSIYMFRQADVELFDLVRKHGLKTASGNLSIETLRLTTNFRSTAGVVDPLNRMFEVVFPYGAKGEAAAVDFLPGVASNQNTSDEAYQVHADFVEPKQDSDDGPSSGNHGPSPSLQAQQREVASMMAVIQRHIPALDKANRSGQEFTVAVLARVKSHLEPLAAALRDANIPFRAIELEGLGERQEILDLLSLTRALLHPMDRIAWLALLRAPWCGLMLRELHALCGTDENRYPTASVQQQVKEHLHLLDADGRARVSRVLAVLEAALQRRYSQVSFAAWIERTWHSLGGPACVDAMGYQNALTYFRMLEGISLDGIGAVGEAMLDRLSKLFGQPDPSVSERCGIQLMTIHKAKGLGFNVVLVPGLHRRAGDDDATLIRYLERSTEAGTELLVAPISSKGGESSPLNEWVRGQQQEREAEERKRLLYVACTRAREELHLFGTASITNSGVTPGYLSLLQTGWPSLEQAFVDAHAQQTAGSSNVIPFPSPDRPKDAIGGIINSLAAGTAPNRIRRLPADWRPPSNITNVTVSATNRLDTFLGDRDARRRPQASRASRVLGTTVHALFEQVSRLLREGVPEEQLRSRVPLFHKQAVTLARNEGLSAGESQTCAKTALDAVEAALDDVGGRWLLGPRFEAQTETSWTGVLDGTIRTLRIDRSFRAGAEAFGEGNDHLWIVDYKTATHSESGLYDFFEGQRKLYKAQLETYGRVMRLAHGEDLPIRLGLYYPLLRHLDWWIG